MKFGEKRAEKGRGKVKDLGRIQIGMQVKYGRAGEDTGEKERFEGECWCAKVGWRWLMLR